jgi:hypothetical protein
MDTSLERIRAKIAELEAKIADLRIAEREIQALEKLPARKTRPAPGPKPKPKPEASNQAEAPQTVGSAIADVLGQQGALSAAEIAEHIRATGRDITASPRARMASGRCGRPALGELGHDGKPNVPAARRPAFLCCGEPVRQSCLVAEGETGCCRYGRQDSYYPDSRIAGGSGLVGHAAIKFAIAAGHFVSALVRRSILPVRSTMQIAVIVSETSIPTYCSMRPSMIARPHGALSIF